MDRLAETIDTYEQMAEAMSDYFRSINKARKTDVDKAFELFNGGKNPFVLEIGCADGRDAAYITQKTNRYIGFDPAEKFIEMAKRNVPGAQFVVADARTYDYPKGIDIVFAFASLLHLSKEENQHVFRKIGEAMNSGGILYLSLKKGAHYESYEKQEKHGKRLFYLYNPELIIELVGLQFESVFVNNSGFVTTDTSEWFEIALRKQE